MKSAPDFSTIVSDARMYGCGACGAEIIGGGGTNPSHPVPAGVGQRHRARREGLGLEPTELDWMIESNGSDAALVDDEARAVAFLRLVDELVAFVAEHGFPDEVEGWDDNLVRDACARAAADGVGAAA